MQLGYLELKLSWELFHKAPETLSAPERGQLSAVAARQNGIEQRILGSSAAANVIVPAATLAIRLAEIRQRYASDDDYRHDLERSGLSEASLEAAVERDLRVESVLEKVAADTPPVSAVDAEIYYRLHPEAFDRPPARRLRHILVTFNNPQQKLKVLKQLEALRPTLTTAESFAAAALRHSQCPTAVEGGKLGVVKHGQLYAELEPAAFDLAENAVSPVLESPVGLHLLRCDEILPSGLLSFAEVGDKIIERLSDKRRRDAQRRWLLALPKA
ncbi:MAG: nitrogen fixation protein NifM [Bacteroidota bacterium]